MSPLPTIPASLFRSTVQLLQKKFRRESGMTLAEGRRLVREALDAQDTIVYALMTNTMAESGEGEKLISMFGERKIPLHGIQEKQMGRLSDTMTSQGILAVIRTPGCDADRIIGKAGSGSLIVALEGISDPGNLGTMLRTCAWFGVDGVLLTGGSAEIANPKVIRATMGAIFHVPVAEGVDLAGVIPSLKRKGVRIVVTSASGSMSPSVTRQGGGDLVVFGSEARGVSEGVTRVADVTLGIPRFGRGESLNVSVAAGIVLHLMKSRSG